MKKQKILQEVFGHEKFRHGQSEVIDAILDETNQGILTVMPTGRGKSLLYQISSLMMDGVSIIISPLISLMKDQVDSLKRIGVPADFYNSSLTETEKRQVWDRLVNDKLKILYLAPERFTDTNFLMTLKLCNIGLFAVDESHCISTWGHDFRPHYRMLKDVTKELNPKQIVALTATATKRVQEDICTQLNIPKAKKFITGFYRDDLNLTVNRCVSSSKMALISKQVQEFIDKGWKTGIIYAPTRAVAETISETLRTLKIQSMFYHAGLSNTSRQQIQNYWFSNGGILVATVAFGMGIDKSDVRFVLHAAMPSSIENYYQEIGRASRDGLGADCIIYTDVSDDYRLQQFFINLSYPREDEIKKFWWWCSRTADKRNIISLTQKEMANRCKGIVDSYSISGCISKLQEGKLIETLGKGSYQINKHLDINKEIDFPALNEKRLVKMDTLAEIRSFVMSNNKCRMLKILEYFDDYSYTTNCQKCDFCARRNDSTKIEKEEWDDWKQNNLRGAAS